jgi:hypothetical protein
MYQLEPEWGDTSRQPKPEDLERGLSTSLEGPIHVSVYNWPLKGKRAVFLIEANPSLKRETIEAAARPFLNEWNAQGPITWMGIYESSAPERRLMVWSCTACANLWVREEVLTKREPDVVKARYKPQLYRRVDRTKDAECCPSCGHPFQIQGGGAFGQVLNDTPFRRLLIWLRLLRWVRARRDIWEWSTNLEPPIRNDR